jgi:hypothetical protein
VSPVFVFAEGFALPAASRTTDVHLLFFEDRPCSRALNGFNLLLNFIAASPAGELTEQINDVDPHCTWGFLPLSEHLHILRLIFAYTQPDVQIRQTLAHGLHDVLLSQGMAGFVPGG